MTSTVHTVTVDQIAEIATQYYTAFPDVRESAQEWASAILKQTSAPDLDPNQLFWQRFDNAQSSAYSYTGWQHVGPATSTLSLTELVIRRFDLQDQIDFDLLDQMSGLYTTERSSRFDHTNEVALAPQKVLKALWAIDFKTLYLKRLTQFWKGQGRNGRALLKAMFFPNLWGAYLNNSLTKDQVKLIINTFCGNTEFPPTLQDIQRESVQRRYAQVYTLTLGGVTAIDILRIEQPDGGQLLCLGGIQFKAFDNEQGLYDWVARIARDASTRDQLVGHFFDIQDPADPLRDTVEQALASIANTSWQPRQRLLNSTSQPVLEDVFSYEYRLLQQRTERDAAMLLQSNYELRKQLLLVDLDCLARISAGLAPGDPLLALVSAGATSFSLGAHIYNAIYGKTREERRQSFRLAVVQGLVLLFDLPLLGPAGQRTMAEFADLQEVAAGRAASEANTALQSLASGELDIALLPRGTGLRRGVRVLDEEHLYIQMHGDIFQVRYVESLKRWYVVDPANPQSLIGTWPVVRDWRGLWQPYTEAAPVVVPVPTAPPLPMPPSAGELAAMVDSYDTGRDFEELMRSLIGPDARYFFQGPPQGVFKLAREQLLHLRLRLAQASAGAIKPGPGPGPAVPAVNAETTPGQFFETLYSDARGLVVGEGVDAIGSKKLLIKCLAQLRELGVDTFYLEGFTKDLDQPMLDLFEQTGTMPRRLEKRLRMLSMSSIQPEMARYNHFRLLTEARRQGLKLKALDCAASMSSEGLETSTPDLAHRLRSWYAAQRIASHTQAAPGSKWIALVSQEQAADRGTLPGLASLSEAVHLRVVDVERTLATCFSVDSGSYASHAAFRVKGHVRLDMAVLHSRKDIFSRG
jgi:hypothetical protein